MGEPCVRTRLWGAGGLPKLSPTFLATGSCSAGAFWFVRDPLFNGDVKKNRRQNSLPYAGTAKKKKNRTTPVCRFVTPAMRPKNENLLSVCLGRRKSNLVAP
jgi:hypothetical protein